jgi:hypothetical protein
VHLFALKCARLDYFFTFACEYIKARYVISFIILLIACVIILQSNFHALPGIRLHAILLLLMLLRPPYKFNCTHRHATMGAIKVLVLFLKIIYKTIRWSMVWLFLCYILFLLIHLIITDMHNCCRYKKKPKRFRLACTPE